MLEQIFNIAVLYAVSKMIYIDLIASLNDYNKTKLPVIILQIISLAAMFLIVVHYLFVNVLWYLPRV